MIRQILASFALLALSTAGLSAAPILNPSNGHYYEYIPGSTSWTDANAAAESMSFMGIDGHLVDIADAAENNFAFNLIDFSHPDFVSPLTWIGLNDIAVEGTYVWTTGEPFVYDAWAPFEPNNAGDEDYVHFWGSGSFANQWNDLNNNPSLGGYIVEFTPSATPVPEPASVALWSLLGMAGLGYSRLRRRK